MLRSVSSLFLIVPLAVVVGCPGGELQAEGEGEEGEGEEGEGDEGEGEGEEGEGEEGEGEPPPPPPPANDTCATAEDIGAGGTVEGTTTSASNDTPCPDFSDPDFPEFGGGEDVAYTFTIAEPSRCPASMKRNVIASAMVPGRRYGSDCTCRIVCCTSRWS